MFEDAVANMFIGMCAGSVLRGSQLIIDQHLHKGDTRQACDVIGTVLLCSDSDSSFLYDNMI